MIKIMGEISIPKFRVIGVNILRSGASTGSTNALVIQ